MANTPTLGGPNMLSVRCCSVSGCNDPAAPPSRPGTGACERPDLQWEVWFVFEEITIRV